jgi:peptidoglycan/xylan/chitin deacetylase (PgdA/CDA1 family)
MRSVFAGSCLLALVGVTGPAVAADCPGNPEALGTSRTLVIDPLEHNRLGGFQYAESLPLRDKEVVLTFDDGPLAPYSNRILDILSAECVKATFFIVGRMARSFPALVRRAHDDGHTIANHSQNHPFTFHKMTVDQAAQEIEDGFTSIRAALGDGRTAAPFFRFPGLLRQDSVERYLAAQGYMAWSVDFMADDWTRISAQEVVRRSLMRLEAKGRGILLLHDIQPATALGLHTLLRELKARGYKVVHVVPATASRPKTATEPQQWAVRRAPQQVAHADFWPSVMPIDMDLADPVLAAPGLGSLGVSDAAGVIRVALAPQGEQPRTLSGEIARPAALWPRSVTHMDVAEREVLPAPGAENFRYLGRGRPARQISARKSSPRKFTEPHKKVASSPATTGSVSQPALGTNAGPRAKQQPPAGHQLQIRQRPEASLTVLEKIGLRLSSQ